MSIEIKSADKDQVYDVIKGIIAARGRPVTITVSLGLQICPTCNGSDPFCPTCAGNQRVHLEQDIEEIALVRWKNEERRVYRPEGQYFEGDCNIVLLNKEPDASLSGALAFGTEYIVRRAISVQVDDKRLVIDSFKRAGYPTNRFYLICNEDEVLSDVARPS